MHLIYLEIPYNLQAMPMSTHTKCTTGNQTRMEEKEKIILSKCFQWFFRLYEDSDII